MVKREMMSDSGVRSAKSLLDVAKIKSRKKLRLKEHCVVASCNVMQFLDDFSLKLHANELVHGCNAMACSWGWEGADWFVSGIYCGELGQSLSELVFLVPWQLHSHCADLP